MIHPATLLLGLPLATASSPAAVEPHGRYVEARTATVFAGACHFGAQATTQGRCALLAWHFEGGVEHGVELAGADVVAVLSADQNLAEPKAARRSWIYVSERCTPVVREAAVAWLRDEHADLFGAVQSVRSVPLSVAMDAERYAVRSPAGFELTGAALPDRACCSMPFNVWYRPFVALDGALVGFDDEFRVSDRAVDERWSRPDENAAFSGRFGASVSKHAND